MENIDAKIDDHLIHWDAWWKPKIMDFLNIANPQMQHLASLGWKPHDIYAKFEAEYAEYCSKGVEEYKDHLMDEFNSGNLSYGEMYRRIIEIQSVKPEEL